MSARLLGALVAPLLLWAGGQAESQNADQKVAVLQGLDKVTARISTIRAPINQPVRFGTLLITARTCNKRPPEEPPETSAFLEIYDLRQGTGPMLAYSGWMFASSPALATMEHAVYDISVIDCVIAAR
ncbi:MAG: DUF2155 domain-containing protein [Alphaproteobacteria bacterium]|nr:DUF2155 domain-containing protein [Alphaproteobacteria bacterium]